MRASGIANLMRATGLRRGHTRNCAVQALASLYRIDLVTATDTYVLFDGRMARDEKEFNDRNCSCGLLIKEKANA